MAELRQIVVLGTGGTCSDIVDTILDIADDPRSSALHGPMECIGFLDDDTQTLGQVIGGVPVLGPLEMALQLAGAFFVNGIGSPRSFRRKPEVIAGTGVPLERFLTLLHPTSSVSRRSSLGKGTVLLQHVTVATNAGVGNHVVVLPSSIISHDVHIGDYCCIAGGVCISGNVSIGKSCYLGAGSTIRDGVAIGDGSMIGMGANVLSDVEPDSIMVGNPARPLSRT